MNVPYVKKYDENGTLINKINGSYENTYENRSERRFRTPRFQNNRKSCKLLVFKSYKLRKFVQEIIDKKSLEKRTVIHYLNN